MITPEQLAKSNTEDAHQMALFCWCNLNLELYPELRWLFAIPNGGLRDKITAGKLKATGVKSGVPDICLPVPRRGLHGLFIELKRPKSIGKAAGSPSDNQIDWKNYLIGNGYTVKVCWGWEEARDFLIWYLETKEKFYDVK